jgi:hypothetical protein
MQRRHYFTLKEGIAYPPAAEHLKTNPLAVSPGILQSMIMYPNPGQIV